MLRSVIAIVAGFLAAAALVVVATWIVAPALGMAGEEPTAGYLLMNLMSVGVAGMLGGYVAGRLAPHAHWSHVATAAIVLLSLPGMLQPSPSGQPTWYSVLLALLGAAAALLGGVLALRSTQRHRAVGT